MFWVANPNRSFRNVKGVPQTACSWEHPTFLNISDICIDGFQISFMRCYELLRNVTFQQLNRRVSVPLDWANIISNSNLA